MRKLLMLSGAVAIVAAMPAQAGDCYDRNRGQTASAQSPQTTHTNGGLLGGVLGGGLGGSGGSLVPTASGLSNSVMGVAGAGNGIGLGSANAHGLGNAAVGLAGSVSKSLACRYVVSI